MGTAEAWLNIPALFLLLIMAKKFGGRIPDIQLLGRSFSGSVVVIILIIGPTSWMYLAFILQHILPSSAAPIVVAATLSVGNAILTESCISFLGLRVRFHTTEGVVHAANGISYSVQEDETVALVGESGCGRATAGRTILGLYPPSDGEVWIEGVGVRRRRVRRCADCAAAPR